MGFSVSWPSVSLRAWEAMYAVPSWPPTISAEAPIPPSPEGLLLAVTLLGGVGFGFGFGGALAGCLGDAFSVALGGIVYREAR